MTDQPINGTPPQQQLQIPIECAPRAIPVSWSIQYNADTKEVAVILFDATGQRWAIFDHESAARFAEDILRQAGIARTGLVIP